MGVGLAGPPVVALGVPLAVMLGVGLADGVATADELGRCGEFSAAWSASAMASWPMAVGWNGAGSRQALHVGLGACTAGAR